MTDKEQAALWRRQFNVLDSLVYGFLEGEGRKELTDEQRAESGADENAVVTVDELSDWRYKLATPLYYGDAAVAGFKASDPTDSAYVGRRAAELLRDRRELEGEL
jgi:hypothetical protein